MKDALSSNLYGFIRINELSAWLGLIFTVFGIIYVVNAVNLIGGIGELVSGFHQTTALILIVAVDMLLMLLCIYNYKIRIKR